MEKNDYELKLKIVREKEEGYGSKYLSKKYNIKLRTIKNWINQYQMFGEDGLKKSMSKTNYSGEFKLSVLKYRQNHELSYRQTAEHFGIKNPSTIANWKRTYEEKGFDALYVSAGRPRKNGDSSMPKNTKRPKTLNKSEREELIELRERNQYLEAENLYLKKLDAFLQEKKSQTKRKQK